MHSLLIVSFFAPSLPLQTFPFQQFSGALSSHRWDASQLTNHLTEPICGCSVTEMYLALCEPMDCSTSGLPVHHQFLAFAQTHVHWVCDAIQPSHPLSSPSPPAFNLFQHQGLFKWVSSSHQVAKVLEFFSFSISPQWILDLHIYSVEFLLFNRFVGSVGVEEDFLWLQEQCDTQVPTNSFLNTLSLSPFPRVMGTSLLVLSSTVFGLIPWANSGR